MPLILFREILGGNSFLAQARFPSRDQRSCRIKGLKVYYHSFEAAATVALTAEKTPSSNSSERMGSLLMQ